MPARLLLLLPGDRPRLALAGARIGVRALAADRQAPPMAKPAVAGEVHQPLDVHRGVAAKVALDAVIAVDGLADVEHFLVGEVLDPLFGRDSELLGDLAGRGPADTVDVGQRDFHALVGGDVDPGDTSHSFPLSSSTGVEVAEGKSHAAPRLSLRFMTRPKRKTDARTNAPPGTGGTG